MSHIAPRGSACESVCCIACGKASESAEDTCTYDTPLTQLYHCTLYDVCIFDVCMCDIYMCDMHMCDMYMCDVYMYDIYMCDMYMYDIYMYDIYMYDIYMYGIYMYDIYTYDICIHVDVSCRQYVRTLIYICFDIYLCTWMYIHTHIGYARRDVLPVFPLCVLPGARWLYEV